MSLAVSQLENHLYGRHLLDFTSYSGVEIEMLLDMAAELKQMRAQGRGTPFLAGKTLGMIFDKASTRTRVSFEVGMFELGGHALFLSNSATQLGRGEPLHDTARVLSRYVHGIMIRTFSHANVEQLAHYASIPVINGLTDDHHPCQVLADLLTIREKKGHLRGLTLAYVGDGNNMANSLLQAAPLVGMNIRVATPLGYEPKPEIVQQVKKWAHAGGTEVRITTDPWEAVRGADVIYTDVWASMGQEESAPDRVAVFQPYQVNHSLLTHAAAGAIFLHCLPAHRGEEVTDDVLEGSQSAVFDQAENRLHVQKAVLVATMGAECI